MAKPSSITIRPSQLAVSRDPLMRLAKGDSEDANPAPLYEAVIRDTIER
jgi:hypothetical protein